ncbi:MAG: CvpA family protein [Sphaerochaetaceae bacterium]|jgi:membrane protein required for colicin V production
MIMAEWGFEIGSIWFNAVDILMVACVLIGAIAGAVRSFSIEFSSRAGFLVGLALAIAFTRSGSTIIIDKVALSLLPSTLIAFLILFTVGYLVTMLLGKGLDALLDALHLGFIDRLLGLILGMCEILIVISAIVFILDLQSLFDLSQLLNKSYFTVHLIRPLATAGTKLIGELI